MDATPAVPPAGEPSTGKPPVRRKGAWPLVKNTLSKAWECNIFSEAAEAAYWQTLSLAPLLLGLLGLLGYVGDWAGPHLLESVESRIITFSRTVFSTNAVDTIIQPTVSDILTKAHNEIASVGFVISLWAGSSAMASFVDAITVAYGQYGVRNEVWQRFFALILYVVGLVLALIGLPVLALGPDYLPKVFPGNLQDTVSTITGIFYYPVVAVILALALTTLYKLALPRKLPWHRGLPGAVLAMVIFLLSSVGIRIYFVYIGKTGYTYGALAAPIAFLLLTFFIGLAIAAGAYFNSAIQDMWPAKMTQRQRRKWRRLEMERAKERLRAAEHSESWTPSTDPVAADHLENGHGADDHPSDPAAGPDEQPED
jgi:membrane protein